MERYFSSVLVLQLPRLGLDAPGSEQVPGGAEVQEVDLLECLAMEDLKILAQAAPFLQKWAQRSHYAHPIFYIGLSFGGVCSIFQSIGPRLYLLASLLTEQRSQVSS